MYVHSQICIEKENGEFGGRIRIYDLFASRMDSFFLFSFVYLGVYKMGNVLYIPRIKDTRGEVSRKDSGM